MLRLPKWRVPFVRPRTDPVLCVLVFPDSTESRWFERVPSPGSRIRSEGGHYYWGRTWVVEEVLQSGINTYTVFLASRRDYARTRRESAGDVDMAAELLELARRAGATVEETRRRRRARRFLP
jgi:hypothetical protein